MWPTSSARNARLGAMHAACASILIAAAAAQQFPVGQTLGNLMSFPTSVGAADFDGDGDQDLVSGASTGMTLAWFENRDALGSFGAPSAIAGAPGFVRSAVPADIDGDGDADVLAAAGAGFTVVWHSNADGLGGFAAASAVGPLSNVMQAIEADLDGDGDADVVATGYKAVWFENVDGLGAFGPEQFIASNAIDFASVDAADFDGDGDIDVLCASYEIDLGGPFDPRLHWNQNLDGLGSFGVPKNLAVGSTKVNSASSADLDGDGDQDVLFGDSWLGSLSWFRNLDAAGTFGPKQVVSGTGQVYSAHAADVDGDGDQDLMGAGTKLLWSANADGIGGFAPAQVIQSSTGESVSSRTADLDGDGDLDAFAVWGGEHRLAWHENANGLGAFGPQQTLVVGMERPNTVEGPDLDGDGDRDVLVSSGWNGLVLWSENLDGQGHLGSLAEVGQLPKSAQSSPKTALAADIDGDGDLDVASAAWSPSQVSWFENADGLAGFGHAHPVTSAFPNPDWMGAADVDGDGDLDLLLGSENFDTIAWSANADGLGSFSPPLAVTTATNGLQQAYVADIDGDGDADVVSVSNLDDEVAWYENADGLGGFGPQQIISTAGDAPHSVVAADVDGDGATDVIASLAGDDQLAWYRNMDGLGSFGPPAVFSTAAPSVTELAAADLDGDGDPDTLTASWVSDEIAWYRNVGGPSAFGAKQLIAGTADGAQSPRAADLDGDGDLDVLAALEFARQVVWYRNECSPLAAAEVVRLGSPPNPAALLAGVTSGPVIGATWDPVVDHASFLPAAVIDVLAITPLPANLPTPFGTLLCDLGTPPLLFTRPAGVPFAVAIPSAGCALVGATASAQAAALDGVSIALTNALDVTLGTF